MAPVAQMSWFALSPAAGGSRRCPPAVRRRWSRAVLRTGAGHSTLHRPSSIPRRIARPRAVRLPAPGAPPALL